MPRPSSSSPLSSPPHAALHNRDIDIRMIDPDAGSSVNGDDTQAFRDALEESAATGGSIYLPPSDSGYQIRDTIDLSTYNNVHIIGGHTGAEYGSYPSGTYPPSVLIGMQDDLTGAVFYCDGEGQGAANHTFENIGIYAQRTGFHYKNSSNIKFKNVVVKPQVNDGNALNAAIVMHNTFWVWYEHCAFHSPATDDPSVILLAEDIINVAPNLQTFADTSFWGGGVKIQMNDQPSGFGAITFTRCVNEGSAKPMLVINESSPGGGWGLGSLCMRQCQNADPVGAPDPLPLVHLNATNCTLQGPYFEHCAAGSQALMRVSAGTVTGAFIVSGPGSTGDATAIFNDDYTATAGHFVTVKRNGIDITSDDSGAETETAPTPANGNATATRYFRPGDAAARHAVVSSGKHYWGGGSGAYDTTLYRSAANVLKTDDKLLVALDAEIDGALDHDGTTVGFYGVTPTTRPTAYTQTYATADKTHANPTAATLTVADGAGTNDNTIGAITADASVIAAVQEIADEINKLVADVADVKQLANSVIDDLQTLGILQ